MTDRKADSRGTAKTLSHRLDVGRLPAGGRHVVIDADEAERNWLAANLKVEEVNRFHADVNIKPWRREGARVTGMFDADIVQNCVVTLEPVSSHLSEEFDVTFLPANDGEGRSGTADAEFLLDPDAPDSPDYLDGNMLDVAAVAIEQMALSIDLYPRKPDADLEPEYVIDEDEDRKQSEKSPFSALESLKRDMEKP